MTNLRRLLVLPIALALLTACEGDWINDPAAPGPRVAVQADSLIDQYDGQWESGTLAGEGPLAIWSVSGSRFNNGQGWIETVRPVPDVFVIAQGINNALYGGWNTQDETDLTRLIWDARRAPGVVACIVLVTPGYGDALHATNKIHARNAAWHVRNRHKSNTNVFRLAEWRNVSLAHPEYYQPDGVHFTAAGSAAYEATITAAVRTCR